jgi:hypothetical protein
MASFSLGKPMQIGGEEVIVVRDILGAMQTDKASETYSMVEPKGADGRPAIYVSENDLARLREDYPGMKVYGLWQLMFHNNAVLFGSPVVAFPLSDPPESQGLYLLLEGDLDSAESIVSSGEYAGGYIIGNYDIDVEKANFIQVVLDELKLPLQPAYTRLELSQKLKAENKRRWLVVGSMCALIAVGAAATNYGLQTIYKSRMADYTTKRSLIDELDGRVRALSAERLITRPDDSVMLGQLFKLFELYPNAVTPAANEEIKIGFAGAHILITPKKAPVDPAMAMKGVASTLQPDLSYRLTIQPPGDEEKLIGGAIQ